MENLMPKVEISYGEYFDKWSILQVKSKFLQKSEQLKRVENEMEIYLKDVTLLTQNVKSAELLNELYEINLKIWELMNQLYAIEEQNKVQYVELTLEITEWNKKRAYKKSEIDDHFNSEIREAKSYF